MFQLTANGLKQATILEDKDFVFEVGGTEYTCCRFQACFFSPRIAGMLLGDKTVDRIEMDLEDKDHRFRDIIALMNGESVEITSANVHFLELCALEFQNEEVLSYIGKQHENRMANVAEAIKRIHLKKEFHQRYDQELDFIASHFYELKFDAISKLSVDDMELILQNDALKLGTEEQLLDIILELQSKVSESYSVLFRYIQFQYLEGEKLQKFLDSVYPDLVDVSLWRSICGCLERIAKARDLDDLVLSNRYMSDLFTYSTDPFGGIIAHLRAQAGGGDILEKGVIDITASSNQGRCYHLVDASNDWWYSRNVANSYVIFDFKSYRVSLTGYSLKSDGEGVGHLISWVVEGSDDATSKQWQILDERQTDELDGDSLVMTYECPHKSDKFYRYLRIRQTSKNSYGSDYFKLSQIEFFGEVKTLV